MDLNLHFEKYNVTQENKIPNTDILFFYFYKNAKSYFFNQSRKSQHNLPQLIRLKFRNNLS